MKPEFPVEFVRMDVNRGVGDTMFANDVDWCIEEPIPYQYAEQIVANLRGKSFKVPGFDNPVRIGIDVTDLPENDGEKCVKFDLCMTMKDGLLEGALWPAVDTVHQAIWDEYARLKQLAADLAFVKSLA